MSFVILDFEPTVLTIHSYARSPLNASNGLVKELAKIRTHTLTAYPVYIHAL
jgi:hypothetical protein